MICFISFSVYREIFVTLATLIWVFTSMNHDMYYKILTLQRKLCHIGYIDMVFHQYESWYVFSVYRKSFVTLATLIWFFIYKNIVFNSSHKKMDKRLATLATLIRFLLCAALNDTNNDIVFEIFSYDCSHKMSTKCTW